MTRRMDASLENLVWKRARDCCEYCRMPQAHDELWFEIDHIIAKKHGGRTVAENLALACFFGNNRKGPTYPALIRRAENSCPSFIPAARSGDDTFAGTGHGSLGEPKPAGPRSPSWR